MQLIVDSGQLPVGWEVKTIGEVCKTGAGGTPLKSKKEYYEGGKIPWLLSGEVAQGEIFKSENFITQAGLNNSSAKIFPINTVLVAMYGATAGQVGILRFEAATNQAVCGILPNERFIPEFIYYVLLLKKAELISKAAGNAQPNISQIKIKNTEIPIPPLPEQKRIVAILDEAFEGIDRAISNTEKNLSNARELFDSIIQTAIFADYEGNWPIKTVADVLFSKKGSIRTGPFGSQLLHSEFVDEGIAVLGIDNAVENEFKWGKRRFITPEKFRQLSRYQVKPGDVLITIMGTCGRCAIVPDDIPVAINSKHLCCITLDQQQCLPSFLHAYFLYHPIARKYLTERAKGSIMSGLNMEIIKELPLYLPPISEQQIIIERVKLLSQEIRNLEYIYRQKIAALKELKQSILQKAFTGELTANKGITAMEETAA